ncbi:MAG: tyrosine-type recombinase/integrase [Opitutaceae bacterium]|nr:tyrosine-type recombinase/integrase [Opitutaceae bacterium]
MPRRSKGPRLWRRPARKGKSAVWVIKDAGRQYATGCVANPSETQPPKAAEEALAAYIAGKHNLNRRLRDISEIDIADVLAIYHADKIEGHGLPNEFEARIGRLNSFWGGHPLSWVSTATCQEYARTRGATAKQQGWQNASGARRELEDLRAAINHHSAEGYHRAIVKVWLPEKPKRRERWLTRHEAAALLWSLYRYRETQTLHAGDRKGEKIITARYPLRHVARFVLIGLYTGTRCAAIAASSPIRGEGRAFVDLDRGMYFRLAQGHRETSKRQPPAPLPTRLLAHMRRWVRRGIAKQYFVEWGGKPVRRVSKGFRHGVELAKLSAEGGRVIPHTLRHTSATWLMQAGVDLWAAAGFLGMTVETLERNYGHHHPDYMLDAANALSTGRRKSAEKVVVSVAGKKQGAGSP